MKEIALTQNKVALVDDADYERILRHKWFAKKDQHHTWHARRNVRSENGGRRRTELMHRFILDFSQKDPHVDHRDGDGLNNQRINLRSATRAGNASNIKVRADSASGIKGVRWNAKRKKWSAQIKSGKKCIWLGYFKDQNAAARAYDTAAIKHHGEFARVNFSVPT